MGGGVVGSTGRGTRSKGAILTAARSQFMEGGYDRTTIRSIAAVAGTDPAMVIRYFGSKEALFREASQVDLHLPDLGGAGGEEAGLRLMQHFVWLWDDQTQDDRLKFLFRASVTNEQAASLMRRAFEEQILGALKGVVPDQPLRRAVMVATQLLGLAFCRHVIALEPLASTSVADLQRDFAPVLQRALFDPLID